MVLLDPTSDTGARNERRLAAVQMGKTPGFEVVQGLLDYVMKMLEVPFSEDGLNEHKRGYCLQPSQGVWIVGG